MPLTMLHKRIPDNHTANALAVVQIFRVQNIAAREFGGGD